MTLLRFKPVLRLPVVQQSRSSGRRVTLRRGFSSTASTWAAQGGKVPPTPKFRYLALVAILGSAAFALSARFLVNKKQPKLELTDEEYEEIKSQKKPAFKSSELSVVFVLGGPGAGKGTQCENLVRDFQFKHLAAGDLLREEQKRPNSTYGELIATYIKEGQIVPQEITIALLREAMTRSITEENKTRFLIDGFPRKMDQAIKFEEDVAVSKLVLFFECPEEVMLKRLLKRGETSGRTDDNIESIKKRFRVFEDTSMPVVRYFDNVGKVCTVSCNDSKERVYEQVQEALKGKGVI